MSKQDSRAVVRFQGAKLAFGKRKLWEGLDLEVKPGEFLAVLGPNGSGKTTLLRILLGLQQLSSGSVSVLGQPPKRGNGLIGYVPQQKAFDTDLPIRGRDLVELGLDGHHYGFSLTSAATATLVNKAIEAVGASSYANAPIGQLSGGEQQRLRIAQALVGDPKVLLCDEPLLSLDPSHQQVASALIDQRRRQNETAVIFVTHEINPILTMVDRVLYLVGGNWAIGTPQEVLTSERLTDLYGAPVDVLRVRGRVVVVGTGDAATQVGGDHHHDHSHDKRRA